MAFPLSYPEKNQELEYQQNIGSLLDGCDPFVELPANEEMALTLRVTGNQYNELFSALLTGVELTYPEKYLTLIALFLQAAHCPATLPETNECFEYPAYAPFIAYTPQNPYNEPDLVPSGYLFVPFNKFSDFLLIGWLSTWFPSFTESLTGYLPDDIIVDISSLPLLDAFMSEISGLPQIQVTVQGEGVAELHLLSFPLGGRIIVTVDEQPNLLDFFAGAGGNGVVIESERDLTSIPIENDATIIEEIEVVGIGQHIIYITFAPVLDLDAIPIKFGGGIRHIVLCGFDSLGVIMGIQDLRRVGEKLETFENGIWSEKVDLSPLHNALQAQVDSNDIDIANLQAVDVSIQSQVNSNDSDILSIQNINTTQSNDIIALYAENDVHDTDILNLQNQAIGLQSQVTSNDSDISALQLDDTSQDLRITALESAPAGGGSGGVLTAYSKVEYIISVNQTHGSSATWFDLGAAWEIDIDLNGGGIAVVSYALQARMGGTVNQWQSRFRIATGVEYGIPLTLWGKDGADYDSMTIQNLFNDLPSGITTFRLQAWANAPSNYNIIIPMQTASIMAWEIASAPIILNDPLVTFDAGGDPYTKTSGIGQVGIVSIGGNPGNCLLAQGLLTGEYIEAEIDLGEIKTIDSVWFDRYCEEAVQATWAVFVDDVLKLSSSPIVANPTWAQVGGTITALSGQIVRIRYTATVANLGLRIDNLKVYTT